MPCTKECPHCWQISRRCHPPPARLKGLCPKPSLWCQNSLFAVQHDQNPQSHPNQQCLQTIKTMWIWGCSLRSIGVAFECPKSANFTWYSATSLPTYRVDRPSKCSGCRLPIIATHVDTINEWTQKEQQFLLKGLQWKASESPINMFCAITYQYVELTMDFWSVHVKAYVTTTKTNLKFKLARLSKRSKIIPSILLMEEILHQLIRSLPGLPH